MLFQIHLLHRFYLIHALCVTVAAEIGGEPNFDDLLRQVDADQARAEGQHIRVVMLAAV